ncbi:GNAT family N-acetyltransferase [bacterium]|nr:GNAT family N-acetyltransferase [bacterium]
MRLCKIDGEDGTPSLNAQVVESLISTNDPSDAIAAYYAWWHAGTRVHIKRSGKDIGVLLEASSVYGPVVILRASASSIVPMLLDTVPVGRHYFMTPWTLADAVQRVVPVEEVERNCIFCLEREKFSACTAASTSLRIEDNSVAAIIENDVAAKCWLLWESPTFAELAVATEPKHRRRGLARAVVSGMISLLLERHVTPLHIANFTNKASIRLAESLGFTRIRADEFAGYLVKER